MAACFSEALMNSIQKGVDRPHGITLLKGPTLAYYPIGHGISTPQFYKEQVQTIALGDSFCRLTSACLCVSWSLHHTHKQK